MKININGTYFDSYTAVCIKNKEFQGKITYFKGNHYSFTIVKGTNLHKYRVESDDKTPIWFDEENQRLLCFFDFFCTLAEWRDIQIEEILE